MGSPRWNGKIIADVLLLVDLPCVVGLLEGSGGALGDRRSVDSRQKSGTPDVPTTFLLFCVEAFWRAIEARLDGSEVADVRRSLRYNCGELDYDIGILYFLVLVGESYSASVSRPNTVTS